MTDTDRELGAVEILESINSAPGPDDDAEPAPDPATETTTEEEATGEGESEATDQTPEKIVLNGEEYDVEALLSLVEAGKNPQKALAEATKRNQEAAELRRAYEPYIEDVKALHQLPEAQRNRAIEAVKRALSDVGDPDVPDLSPDDMTDTERALHSQIVRLERQLAQMGQKVSSVDGFVQETKTEREARLAAEAINAKYDGANATPGELIELASKSGVSDFRAAWVLANEDRIAKGAFAAGAKAASKPKPKSAPSSDTRTYDPDSVTIDEAINLRMRGFSPR